MDAAHAEWEEQAQVVGEVLQEAGMDAARRVLVALNKADRLDVPDRESRVAEAAARGWEAVLVSATTGEGVEGLRAALAAAKPAP